MNNKLIIQIDQNEYWWCGIIDLSHEMPYHIKSERTFDMAQSPYSELCCNQITPLFLSSKGRYVYMPEYGSFSFHQGELTLISAGEIIHGQKQNLREASCFAYANFGEKVKKMPHPICFTAPQYCTWMELLYGQNQKDILDYAHRILAEGLPAGEFIIDDGWQEYYGHWDFNKRRFPNAHQMCKELIELGFKVVLWIVPYVSPDSDVYRKLRRRGLLITDQTGKPYITEWWNGYSAVLDFSNPETRIWFSEQYQYLKENYGISGLKMDGGDVLYYPKYPSGKRNLSALEHSEEYAAFDCGMEIKELRACVKNMGDSIIQRVADRKHSWDRRRGLGGIVEKVILQGLMGYPFNCPDMVGGGLLEDVELGVQYSEELYCRYAQASTFLPSFQLSKFFWKDSSILKAEVQKMVSRHVEIKDYIEGLMNNAMNTGEPIVRSIAYEFNERPDITDEFLLGDKYLIAPVLQEGVESRVVYFPTLTKGKWKSLLTGENFIGGKEIELQADIRTLLYFECCE